MKNPWEDVSLTDYEAHMQLSDIYQLQTLNQIMKSQIIAYKVDTIAILGIAGGNGLEHVKESDFIAIYGIDINKRYLRECKQRFKNLECLELIQMDITKPISQLPKVELVIANLVIEYIGLKNLEMQLKKQMPKYLSCVIQKCLNNSFVSNSPYENSFVEISKMHVDIEKEELIQSLKTIGFEALLQEEYILPNNKAFLRIDFLNKMFIER